jgi:hypothetical protein
LFIRTNTDADAAAQPKDTPSGNGLQNLTRQGIFRKFNFSAQLDDFALN